MLCVIKKRSVDKRSDKYDRSSKECNLFELLLSEVASISFKDTELKPKDKWQTRCVTTGCKITGEIQILRK